MQSEGITNLLLLFNISCLSPFYSQMDNLDQGNFR